MAFIWSLGKKVRDRRQHNKLTVKSLLKQTAYWEDEIEKKDLDGQGEIMMKTTKKTQIL